MLVPFSSLARNPSLLLLPSAVRAACAAMSTSPPAVTVSVEYAKSGRSTCKGCSAVIAFGALRLGALARRPRGFDSTKWYHVACFPASSHPLDPVESISGFDAIKDDDREELRQLGKNSKRGGASVGPLDEPSANKVKRVSEEASVSVGYAKSGRSTCKGCSENIANGALRLGASAHDPRGFDSTKWYHVACFPASLYPVSCVENLKGLDSIKTEDREKLRQLEKQKEDGNEADDQSNEPNLNKVDDMVDSKEGAGKSLEDLKNSKRGGAAVGPLDEPSARKIKMVSEKASVSVEYAKSGRSTCKGCSENIANGTLRLGASAHDPRGFDRTKWYHVACFPASSYPVSCVENLKGLDSIKTEDREKLRELEEKQKEDGNGADDQSNEPNLNKVDDMVDSKEGAGKSLEDVKNSKRRGAAVGSLDEPSAKKVKRGSEKASVSVEYAKSGRSTCKGCSENIAKGALRLGASAHDPRGFDSTKWYHLACFPASSYPVFCMENLKGLDSIKIEDHEKLRELEEKEKGNVADQSNEPNLNKEMVDNMGDSKEGAGKSLEEMKLSAGSKGTGPLISFSASDVKDEYKGATLPACWKVFNTVIFREKEDGLNASAKIAAFDFDGCLAKTSLKRIGANEWSLMHKSIPEKLQKLYNDGYKLVVFTNQSNIERWKNKRQVAVDSIVGRLDQFIKRVKVPIQVFAACGLGKGKGTPDDQYRKPNPGMWWLMAQHFNSGVQIDMDQSFYVGDAAGRENDHSDADKEFAKAVGLKFHVPEEYFDC